MSGNLGETTHDTVTDTVASDMRAFDKLPSMIRDALNYSDFRYSSRYMLSVWEQQRFFMSKENFCRKLKESDVVIREQDRQAGLLH